MIITLEKILVITAVVAITCLGIYYVIQAISQPHDFQIEFTILFNKTLYIGIKSGIVITNITFPSLNKYFICNSTICRFRIENVNELPRIVCVRFIDNYELCKSLK